MTPLEFATAKKKRSSAEMNFSNIIDANLTLLPRGRINAYFEHIAALDAQRFASSKDIATIDAELERAQSALRSWLDHGDELVASLRRLAALCV